ncbi:MAG: TRAP transporter small permease subunit [Alphaproteobacteria bacterium]|nr:TRAP transporter small permease subunit [Alphaproteobacteria bacterium]
MKVILRSVWSVVALLSVGSVVFPQFGLPWIFGVLVGGALLWRFTGRGGLMSWLGVVDDLLFRGERLILVASLLVMSGVVCLGVVWRTAHGLDEESASGFTVGFLALVMLGAFTARWPGASPLRRVTGGLVVFGLFGAGTRILLLVDGGFGWSQRLALVLLIWVGFVGGSMATRLGRHIAVDAVRRIVPAKLDLVFEVLAQLLTTSLCAFLAVVSSMYCRSNFDDWLSSDRLAFVFESIPIPYWAATVALPIGFTVMAFRFSTQLLVRVTVARAEEAAR